MALLGIILLVLFVLSAILLIVLVLLQDDQGEGLGGLFGGGSSAAFGSRSGNVLTRFTSILGAIFLTCSFGLAWVNKTPESGDVLGVARRERLKDAEEFTWWEEDQSIEGILEKLQENPPEETAEEEAN
jgi:preprotein translocase subunit SecG